MHLQSVAIICANRPHGEHGVITRLLTPDHGLVAGYVRGGRSRVLRPVLIAGNTVMAEFRARNAEQLASLTVELVVSRAPLLADPLASAGMEWACTLVATTVPEEQGYPGIYEGLSGLLDAISSAPSARRWAGAILMFERLLMQSLGYGGTAPEQLDDWASVLAGLAANGAQLTRHLLSDRQRDILSARDRMVDRFKRAVA